MGIFQKEEAIFSRWLHTRPDLVKDGVVDEDAYLSSTPKILLVMKEVNSPDDGNWDLRRFLRKGNRPQTWDNVTRWIIGIRRLQEDIPWRDLKSITEKQRQEHIKSLCVINLKKSPGGHTTNNNSLSEIAHQDAPFIVEQFGLYDPDIVICCGSVTCNLFQEIVKLQYASEWKETKRGIWFREFSQRKFLISYSHPEARVDHSLLYYGMVDAIREIFNMKETGE